MMRLHYNFLFNSKTQKVPLGILFVFLIIILINANIFASNAFIEADYQSNFRLYIFDSITAFMLIDVIVINLVVVHAFIINWYDIQLVHRKTRITVITSKMFVILLYTIWMIMIMTLIIGIIGEIRGYEMLKFIGSYIGTALLFHSYYLMISILFAITYQTIWQTMIPVFGFLSAFIFSSDYDGLNENSIVSIIQLLFPTITLSSEIRPEFSYGNVIVFSIILVLFTLIIKKYQTINLS